MKRLIRSIYASAEVNLVDTSMFDGTPFKPPTTSGYDDFLNDKELKYHQTQKNRTGEIVLMSPNEYFQECADKIFSGRTSVEGLLNSRRYDKSSNANYEKAMRSGAKFPLCYLNYADHQQEGLHRMMIAGDIYGWDTKFPVLVVTAYDQELETQYILKEAAEYFLRYYFKTICNIAEDNIADWNSAPSDNFIDIFHDEIVKVAGEYTEDVDGPFDIDVSIELEDVDGYTRVNVYLIRYSTYMPKNSYAPVKLWLADMYDVGDSADIPQSVNDDMSDDDIVDLFFK